MHAGSFGRSLGHCLWLVLVPAIITWPAYFGRATEVIHLSGDSERRNRQSKCDSAPLCLTQRGQRCHSEKGQQLVLNQTENERDISLYTNGWRGGGQVGEWGVGNNPRGAMQKSKNKSADPARIASLESRSSQVLRYPLSHQLCACMDFCFSTLFVWENNPSMTFPK